LLLLVAILLPAALAHPALADAPAAPNVIHPSGAHIVPLPSGTTAICADGTWSADWRPLEACGTAGGVAQWLAPVTDPSSGPAALATLDTAAGGHAADATVARSLGPSSVQGPAGGAAYPTISSATGPLNVAGALDFHTCQGGPTHVSAVVSDDQGNGVANAIVTGSVQFFASDSSLPAFPPTGPDGFTDLSFNIGHPWGGYDVVFSLDAANAAGDKAHTTVECYAP